LIVVVSWALLQDCRSLGFQPEVLLAGLLGSAATVERRADIAGWVFIAVVSSLALGFLQWRQRDRPAGAVIAAALSIAALYALWPRSQNDLASRIQRLKQAQSAVSELHLYVDSSYQAIRQWSETPHKNRNVAVADLAEIEEAPSAMQEATANFAKRYGQAMCNLEDLEYSPTPKELASTVSDERFVRPSAAEDFDLNELKRKELRSAYFYFEHARTVLSKCVASLKTREQDLEIERLERDS
jgi:hypothetical protein